MATIRKRTNGDGTVSFNVQIRLKGQRPETASFARLTDARKWAQSTETAIKEERHFPGSTARLRTLGELIDRYTASVFPRKQPNSIAVQRPQLAWWKEQVGHLRVSDVKAPVIAEQRDALLEGLKPATVNQYLVVLNHVFVVAIREWGWANTNPVANVTKPKQPQGRVRYLSDDERQRLLTACQESKTRHLFPVVLTALCTGMRKMEVLSLTWQAVDLKQRLITLERTKTGQRRSIPIADVLYPVLSRIPRRLDTDLLFPSHQDPQAPADIEIAWNGARKRASLSDFVFHDLRHTAASYLAMHGASLLDIATILGHRTLAMSQRYAHLSQEHTAKVLNRMTSAVLGG